MNSLEILRNKQEELLHRWIGEIFNSYPADTSKFLLKQKDRFHNPVGFTFRSECPIILGELLGEMNISNLRNSLEKIIKIRAVQDFFPSEALDFIFRLKKILTDQLSAEIKDLKLFKEFLEIDNRLEKIMLIGFDLYTEMKNRIAEVKVSEMRQKTAIIMERINQLFDNPEDFLNPESNEPNNQ